MKMSIKMLALLATAAAVTVGCKDDNDDDDDRVLIRLSSRVELASNLRLQDTQIVEGQSLSFFVTNAGDPEQVRYSNQQITANGQGGFTYQNDMYYPQENINVDFYAIHPYFPGTSLGEALTFTVPADQRTNANYLAADLLHATHEDQGKTVQQVGMQFRHRMARIDLILRTSGNLTLDDLEGVTIENLLPQITMSTTSGTLGTAQGTVTPILVNGIGNITEGATEVTGLSAIVVPQPFTAAVDKELFSIVIGDNEYTYVPPINENYTFNAGSKTTFTLTINPAGITVTSQITDWTDGGSLEGEGNLNQ